MIIIRSRFPPRVSANSFDGYGHWRGRRCESEWKPAGMHAGSNDWWRSCSLSCGLVLKSEGDYSVEVRDRQGKMVRDTQLGRRLKDPGTVRISSTPLFPLKPQESLKDEISVSKLYEMSSPGEYSISVARQVPEQLGAGVVKSNTITVTVEP
jgi:hypothetical protein